MWAHREESHWGSTHWDIRVSVVMELLYDEITISDFPRRSEPLISADETWRKISKNQGSTLQNSWCRKNYGEFTKPRITTGPTGIAWGIDRWHRISEFGTWEVL
jgi:hypothetical protein